MVQPRRSIFVTHRVDNQVPPLTPYDAWATDLPLREAVAREGGGWAEAEIADYGRRAGGDLAQAGFAANENRPKLRAFDRYGHRIDEVEFHPAYHRLMGEAIAHGVPSFGWRHADRPGAHVARMALSYLHNQADQGTGCPLTMTYACVPTLRHQPEIAAEWLPRVLSTAYDPRAAPVTLKSGITVGMGMTEKQGGSDVRANTTHAYPVGAAGPAALYEIVGHKWFLSAPMSDAFLVLAYTDAGLSCFLLPRFMPDGERNALRITRLKDKLGDWSNASSEVELEGALAWMVGAEGRGVATILEMVALTRQDCMIGSTSIMRQALVQAIHHARHRRAFGRPLIDQPLMRNVLADLAIEFEAHLALTARVARAGDRGPSSATEADLFRIATAFGKYWVCKRAPTFVNEAQECLGGAGYVEESILPRLYRQAPLNSIWEGSGNVQCLDVLRALARRPQTREVYLGELGAARGQNAALDALARSLASELAQGESPEAQSRHLVERMAIGLQAALLIRSGAGPIADAFCASRLERAQHGVTFGTLPPSAPVDQLIARAFPEA